MYIYILIFTARVVLFTKRRKRTSETKRLYNTKTKHNTTPGQENRTTKKKRFISVRYVECRVCVCMRDCTCHVVICYIRAYDVRTSFLCVCVRSACRLCELSCCRVSLDFRISFALFSFSFFRRFFFSFRSRRIYDTLALHALVDDTIEKTTAVVTEGGAVVGMLLEMVLRPRVLRYYTITPCTHT